MPRSFAHRAQGAPPMDAAPQGNEFRLDIQGLRAIAVLAVVAEHVLGWPHGGFVGVDIFFVISGFLITGLLLRELDRTGTISFRGFYARRVRRLLPAAVTVLAFTVVMGFALFTSSRARVIGVDAVWSLLFVSNWHFAAAGTDYFLQGAATSPLQHFWTLSVEEQFYFVWPWLLLGVCLVVSSRALGRRLTNRQIAAALIVVLGIASLAWGLAASAESPTSAYFSTVTRVWELGVGALVAACLPWIARWRRMPRRTLQVLGLGGIAAAFIVIHPESTFPAPWGLLPVLATAAVIVGGANGPGPRVLTKPPAVYVGTISYSLYLWHFPLYVFALSAWPRQDALWYAAVLLAITGASVASYHLVEKPVLDSSWLLPRAASSDRRSTYREWRAKVAPSWKVGTFALVAAIAATTVMTLIVVNRPPVNSPVAAPMIAPRADHEALAARFPQAAALQTKVAEALAATSWPELDPPLDMIDAKAKAEEWVEDGCLAAGSEVFPAPGSCVYGTGDRQAALIGDSMAISYAPALRAALGEEWTVRVLTMQQCPFAFVSVIQSDGEYHEGCDKFHQGVLEQLGDDLDLIVATQTDTNVGRMVSTARGLARHTEMEEGLIRALTELRRTGASIVVLTTPPATASISECATAFSRPADCISEVREIHLVNGRTLEKAVAAVNDGVHLINADTWYCSADNWCPVFIGNHAVRADEAHLTHAFSVSLGPVLAETLEHLAVPGVAAES